MPGNIVTFRAEYLQRITTKWRRNREKNRRLLAAPIAPALPSERLEAKTGTPELTG